MEDNKSLVDFIKTFLLPRLDQLEAEVKILRDTTWPVCQALKEDGDPLTCIEEKRKYFRHIYKNEALELLDLKANFSGINNKVIRDQEFDLICKHFN